MGEISKEFPSAKIRARVGGDPNRELNSGVVALRAT